MLLWRPTPSVVGASSAFQQNNQSLAFTIFFLVVQHVGSDADVEANTKLKGLEEKLAAVGQNISLRVKVKEQEDADQLDGEEEQEQQLELDQHRVPQDNGRMVPSQGDFSAWVLILPVQLMQCSMQLRKAAVGTCADLTSSVGFKCASNCCLWCSQVL